MYHGSSVAARHPTVSVFAASPASSSSSSGPVSHRPIKRQHLDISTDSLPHSTDTHGSPASSVSASWLQDTLQYHLDDLGLLRDRVSGCTVLRNWLLSRTAESDNDQKFQLGSLADVSYFGEYFDFEQLHTPLWVSSPSASGSAVPAGLGDPGQGCFKGFQMLVVKPERSEGKRVPPPEGTHHYAVQSLQASFHLALLSLPRMWHKIQLEGGFATVSLLAFDEVSGHYEYLGPLYSSPAPANPEDDDTTALLTLALSHNSPGRNSMLWNKKEGKDAQQNKRYPVPLVLKRKTGKESVERTFRLLVALHAPHDGSVLLDAHAHHCITLTNSFRWSGWSRRKGQEEGKSGEELSKAAENNSESLVAKTEATQVKRQESEKVESSRKSGFAQAWNMDDLAAILSAMKEEDLQRLVERRRVDSENRYLLYAVRSPLRPAEIPNSVPLSYFRPRPEAPRAVHEHWHDRIRAVARYIGRLHANPLVWLDEASSRLLIGNFAGAFGRFNDIIGLDYDHTRRWLDDLISRGLIPPGPGIQPSRVRVEEARAVMGHTEFRSRRVFTLRDIYPDSIVVDKDDVDGIHFLSSEPLEECIHKEDRMVLLARLAHTARIPPDLVHTLLLQPYRAAFDPANPEVPEEEVRRFDWILHTMFLDFHYFFIFYRNADAVKRFREALLQQDAMLQAKYPEYWSRGIVSQW